MNHTKSGYVFDEAIQIIESKGLGGRLENARLAITTNGHMTVTREDGTVYTEGPIQNYTVSKFPSRYWAQWTMTIIERRPGIHWSNKSHGAYFLLRSGIKGKLTKEEYKLSHDRMNRLLEVSKSFGAKTSGGKEYLFQALAFLAIFAVFIYVTYLIMF